MTDGSLPAQFDQLRAGSGSWKIAGLTECRYHLATTPICRNLNSQANSVVTRVGYGVIIVSGLFFILYKNIVIVPGLHELKQGTVWCILLCLSGKFTVVGC